MTLVVALLSHEYTAVFADTRLKLAGPAKVPLQGMPLATDSAYRTDDEGCAILDAGEELQVDDYHPSLSKVQFLGTPPVEAIAFAGTRDGNHLMLGVDGKCLGFEADEQIAHHFAEKAKLHEVTEIPCGLYDACEGLHIYHAGGRSIAAKFEASPFYLCRRYFRSNPEQLIYSAIGSGASHVAKAVHEDDSVWRMVRHRKGIAQLNELIQYWVGIFHWVSQKQLDVNPKVCVWVRKRDEDCFGAGMRVGLG